MRASPTQTLPFRSPARAISRGLLGLVARSAVAILGLLQIGVLAFFVLDALAPLDAGLVDAFPASTRILDRSGATLRVGRAPSDIVRVPVALEEVSPWIAEATIAIEDRKFRSHIGVDPLAVLRAAMQNTLRGEVHSGASTITMQLARVLDPRPRTMFAKLAQAFRAVQLERHFDKDCILAGYLSCAPYGGDVHGVEAAAWRYFGKRARELELSEAALLAGLPQSPSRLRPDRHYDRALARRRVVLDALLAEGRISSAQHAAADTDRPEILGRPWPFEAPHWSERALRTAAGRRDVVTSLDLRTQERVEAQVAAWSADPACASRDQLNIAVVVVDVETARVRALVGSADFFDRARHGQFDGTRAKRSSGSTLKPFLWALALDRGRILPQTRLFDVPTRFATWDPENFDRRHRGLVAADEALRLSLNVPAIRLERTVTTGVLLATLHQLGLRTLDRSPESYGLTLALGGGEVRLIDLVGAYATLARGGVHLAVRVDEAGAGARPLRVFSEGAAHMVLDALSTREHLARIDRPVGVASHQVAYKTGTSFGLRDAWTVALSRELAVGVWVGAGDGAAKVSLIGAQVAAPLAVDICRALTSGVASVLPSAHDRIELSVCARSGRPAGRHCELTQQVDLPRSRVPCPPCDVCREVFLDAERRIEMCARCRRDRVGERRVLAEWPQELRAQIGDLSTRWPHDPSCPGQSSRKSGPRIVEPLAGEEYRLMPELAGATSPTRRQALPLRAEIAPGAASSLWWFVDGELLGRCDASAPLSWPLQPGRHRLRCVDAEGRSDSVTVVVRSGS